MLQRIGNLRPNFFGIADLTSGFSEMTITDESMQSTAFITFRGIYEWTRVPMGLLPSANYFQKMMAEYVLHGLIYIICEVYIDDLLIYGRNEEIPQERRNRLRTITGIQRNIEPDESPPCPTNY